MYIFNVLLSIWNTLLSFYNYFYYNRQWLKLKVYSLLLWGFQNKKKDFQKFKLNLNISYIDINKNNTKQGQHSAFSKLTHNKRPINYLPRCRVAAEKCKISLKPVVDFIQSQLPIWGLVYGLQFGLLRSCYGKVCSCYDRDLNLLYYSFYVFNQKELLYSGL